MRLVVIDTETTGLSPKKGDKMVEIGAIAIEHGRIQMDQTFHHFIDPQRDIPPEVVRIHSIDAAKLTAEGAMPFAALGNEFLNFIAGATLVFHNASFDLGFIKKELSDAGLPGIDAMPVIDTLTMARQRFPKQPNNLDALCDRFSIDRNHRAFHGALIDAMLTAHCFLAMEEAATISKNESAPLPTQSMSGLVCDLYSILERRHQQALGEPLMTGITALDEQHGGLHKGEILLIAGQSDTGAVDLATSILNRLAYRDFDPCSVLIFSLRLSAMQWAEQLLGSEADVDASIMQSGRICAKHWRAFAVASKNMAESDMHICDASQASIQQIRTTCRHIHQQSRKMVILIDDLQRISMPETGMSDHPDFATTTHNLKKLANELHAVIILLAELPCSQQQRDYHTPELSDLQCFGAIERGADMILFTHRSQCDQTEVTIAKS